MTQEVKKAEDMDLIEGVFGFRVVEEADCHRMIELYIEDDDNYLLKTSFDLYWLDCLERGANRIKYVAKAKKDAV
jgi:hypothetical protein